MKKINKALLLILIGCVFGLTSCEDFLKEDPKDRTAVSNFYTSENAAISAVNSIYAHLNSQGGDTFGGVYHGGVWVAPGLASDEMVNLQAGSPDQDQIATFTATPDNGMLYEIWKQHYKAISLANTAIARIPGVDMDATARENLVNEAKFLRGLLYFNLVRLFGEVPLLVEEVVPLTPPNTATADIYAQIIADLTDAESLPATQQLGRGKATSGAAKAILAKVYLTLGMYTECIQKCEEVRALGIYDLWDDFSDIYRIANRGQNEAIFSVGFGTNESSIIFWEVSQMHVRFLPPELQSAGITTNTLGWTGPTEDLANAYDPADERRDVTVFNRFNETVGGTAYDVPFSRYYFRKYWDVTVPSEFAATSAENDFPVIRYADVLLMYAEALNEANRTSDAFDPLNEVRERAGLTDIDGLDQSALRDVILEERRLELAAEGHRWFDLVRTNRLEQVVEAAKPDVNVEPRHYLFPIPQRERDFNPNLEQNDGY
ncbi:RagB/SusD family nutrient uptake outer membrane protein [Roseivirga pacifica]|uniref:RagB/SusD family nutrient uptake outer membrane protein n=1 Tax=Roseivirga pacifica TaxID=1267423 RepID=UPI003BAC278C